MNFLILALAASLVTGETYTGAQPHNDGPPTPDNFVQGLNRKEIEQHLDKFAEIAQRNGNNRAFGTTGYAASADYIRRVIGRRCGGRVKLRVQKFTSTSARTNEIYLTGPDAKPVKVASLEYNTGTDGIISAPLVEVTVDSRRGAGCYEHQWIDSGVSGKIALIQRGGCSDGDKVKLGQKHGALAVVLYNFFPGDDAGGSLGVANAAKLVPSAGVTLDIGTAWSKSMAAGEQLRVGLMINQTTYEQDSENIIAETVAGDADNVIMIGAHLDSVPAGPGINDDAGGSAALMTMLDRVCDFGSFKNHIRFAWWGAEEVDIIGSKHYASQLGEDEADRIRFYFNYDMIGSTRPTWSVFSSSAADEVGAKILYEALQKTETVKKSNASVAMRRFGDFSDEFAFRRLGIPSSGIMTGAGEPAHSCWHQACDDKDNINIDAINAVAEAASIAMVRLANSDLSDVPRRNKANFQDNYHSSPPFG